MGKGSVIGLIVPLSGEKIVHRIFHGKTVWATSPTEETSTVEEGDRAFFALEGSQSLEGEADIRMLSFEPSRQVLARGKRLFLLEAEFSAYLAELGVGSDEEMLVLEFQGAVKYSRPINCSLSVPSTGKCMTKDTFEEILRANRRRS